MGVQVVWHSVFSGLIRTPHFIVYKRACDLRPQRSASIQLADCCSMGAAIASEFSNTARGFRPGQSFTHVMERNEIR